MNAIIAITTDPEGSLERLREQITTTDVLSEDNRDALLSFSDRLALLQSEYSVQRHEKLHRHCAIMANLSQEYHVEELSDVELHEVREDREVAEDLVRWIHDHCSYRITLHVFPV